MSDIAKAIDGLINSLKVFTLQHEFQKWRMSEAKSLTNAETLYSELRLHIDALQSELRAAVRIGTEYGLAMTACAEAVHTAESGVVINAVFGELELLRSRVDGGEDGDITSEYHAAYLLWEDGYSWPDVTEKSGAPRADWKSYSQSVKRYAESKGLKLRKGKPGSKPNRNK